MDGDRQLGADHRLMSHGRTDINDDASREQHEVPVYIDSLVLSELHSPQPVRKGT